MNYSNEDRLRLIDAQADHNLTNKTTVFGRMATEMDALSAELNLPKMEAAPLVVEPGQTRFQALIALT